MARRNTTDTTSQGQPHTEAAATEGATAPDATSTAPVASAPRRGRPRGTTTNRTNGQATPSESAVAPVASDPTPTPRRSRTSPGSTASNRGRRGRRSQSSAGSATGALIEALLKSRGSSGATQAELRRVVAWAEGVNREAVAIETESKSKPRRAPRGAGKTARSSPQGKAAQARRRQEQEEQLRERRIQNQADRALLDGVIAGRVLLDVTAEGDLRFLDATSTTSAPASSPEDSTP